MTLSDVCKFEFKSNVDKIKREKISRNKAIALLADEIGILFNTAKAKYRRANEGRVQNEPNKSQPLVNTTNPPPEIIKDRRPQGARQSAQCWRGRLRPQAQNHLIKPHSGTK